MMSTACLPRSPNWSMMLARILLSSMLMTSMIIIKKDKDENLLWRSSWSATVLPASWASSTGLTFNQLVCQTFKRKRQSKVEINSDLPLDERHLALNKMLSLAAVFPRLRGEYLLNCLARIPAIVVHWGYIMHQLIV